MRDIVQFCNTSKLIIIFKFIRPFRNLIKKIWNASIRSLTKTNATVRVKKKDTIWCQVATFSCFRTMEIILLNRPWTGTGIYVANAVTRSINVALKLMQMNTLPNNFYPHLNFSTERYDILLISQ